MYNDIRSQTKEEAASILYNWSKKVDSKKSKKKSPISNTRDESFPVDNPIDLRVQRLFKVTEETLSKKAGNSPESGRIKYFDDKKKRIWKSAIPIENDVKIESPQEGDFQTISVGKRRYKRKGSKDLKKRVTRPNFSKMRKEKERTGNNVGSKKKGRRLNRQKFSKPSFSITPSPEEIENLVISTKSVNDEKKPKERRKSSKIPINKNKRRKRKAKVGKKVVGNFVQNKSEHIEEADLMIVSSKVFHPTVLSGGFEKKIPVSRRRNSNELKKKRRRKKKRTSKDEFRVFSSKTNRLPPQQRTPEDDNEEVDEDFQVPKFRKYVPEPSPLSGSGKVLLDNNPEVESDEDDDETIGIPMSEEDHEFISSASSMKEELERKIEAVRRRYLQSKLENEDLEKKLFDVPIEVESEEEEMESDFEKLGDEVLGNISRSILKKCFERWRTRCKSRMEKMKIVDKFFESNFRKRFFRRWKSNVLIKKKMRVRKKKKKKSEESSKVGVIERVRRIKILSKYFQIWRSKYNTINDRKVLEKERKHVHVKMDNFLSNLKAKISDGNENIHENKKDVMKVKKMKRGKKKRKEFLSTMESRNQKRKVKRKKLKEKYDRIEQEKIDKIQEEKRVENEIHKKKRIEFIESRRKEMQKKKRIEKRLLEKKEDMLRKKRIAKDGRKIILMKFYGFRQLKLMILRLRQKEKIADEFCRMKSMRNMFCILKSYALRVKRIRALKERTIRDELLRKLKEKNDRKILRKYFEKMRVFSRESVQKNRMVDEWRNEKLKRKILWKWKCTVKREIEERRERERLLEDSIEVYSRRINLRYCFDKWKKFIDVRREEKDRMKIGDNIREKIGGWLNEYRLQSNFNWDDENF